MEQLYPPARQPVLLATRRSNGKARSQHIFIESSSQRPTSRWMYVHATPPMKQGVWRPSRSTASLHRPPSYATFALGRTEYWQDNTPTSSNFPYIRSAHRRRTRARSSVHLQGHSIRKDLSMSIASAYDAAKAPFKPHRESPRLGPPPRRFKQVAPGQEFRRQSIRPPTARTTTNTVEISGPLGSPSSSTRSNKKFFKAKSSKSSVSSPLSLHAPIMPFRASLDGPPKARNSDPPALRHRSIQRSRDSFNRAKIHVRRPPKGISHWFEALDEDSSDDDYPEVADVQQPLSAPPGTTTFQPSLGPQRARAAPTSFVSGSDPYADYFSYSHLSARRRKNSSVERDNANPLRLVSGDPNDRSVLDLSSDEEGHSVPQSPAGWSIVTPSPGPHNPTFLRRATMQRKGSAAASAAAYTPLLRQSMASMQTTLTSGTIPFMLRISPSNDHNTPPPLPAIHRHPASYFALTGRPPTADSKMVARSPSIRQSERSQPSSASVRSGSDHSNRPSEVQHFVAVTAEEMALLEMMRRKRAGGPDTIPSFGPPSKTPISIIEEPESPVSIRPPTATQRKSKELKEEEDALRSTSLSSTVTLETGEEVTFPIPSNSPSINQKMQRGRNQSAPLTLGVLPTPPPSASYWSPEIPEMPTPHEEISELEAIPFVPNPNIPLRFSALGSNPPARRASDRLSMLRPSVFTGVTQSSDSTKSSEPAPPIPQRHSSRQSSLPNTVFKRQSIVSRNNSGRRQSRAYTNPRRTRTYDAVDTFNLMPDLNMDFSDFNLLPLPSHFPSPTFNADDATGNIGRSRSASPSAHATTGTETLDSTTSDSTVREFASHSDSAPSPLCENEDEEPLSPLLAAVAHNPANPIAPTHSTCPSTSSRSPSLTDGSLSGHSRSEHLSHRQTLNMISGLLTIK